MAHIYIAANQAGNNAFVGGQRRCQIFNVVLILVGAQRTDPKQARGHLLLSMATRGNRRQRQGPEPLDKHSGIAEQHVGRVSTG
jgi:hypothetical protein